MRDCTAVCATCHIFFGYLLSEEKEFFNDRVSSDLWITSKAEAWWKRMRQRPPVSLEGPMLSGGEETIHLFMHRTRTFHEGKMSMLLNASVVQFSSQVFRTSNR